MTSRPAAVSGLFYPSDKAKLLQQINYLLEQSSSKADDETIKLKQPTALIVPHAGYIYSGPTAAFAYKQIIPFQNLIKRVILLGPAHHQAFIGMAIPDVTSFSTPLGDVELDSDEIKNLQAIEQLMVSNSPHTQEHSLEVQLPFLQTIIKDFKLIPVVVGQCEHETIAELLSSYINQPENLIVISTDLSHFHDYTTANNYDKLTANKIMHFKYNELDYSDACGRTPLAGLLYLADKKNLLIKQLDLRNSADTAGDKHRVVGYGAWSLYGS